jgi:nucleoside-diphosphate-sugar epimerase
MLHRIPAIEKIEHAIGWQPTRDLDEILADVIEHTRAQSSLVELV